MERERLSQGNSQTGDGRGRGKSMHRKKATKQEALTSWRRKRKRQVRTLKESDQARGTYFLETAEGGTSQHMKESDQARTTHILETPEGGTSQGTERKPPSERHSHPRDGRGRDKSGHWKKATAPGALTSWTQQKERQVRTWKESD